MNQKRPWLALAVFVTATCFSIAACSGGDNGATRTVPAAGAAGDGGARDQAGSGGSDGTLDGGGGEGGTPSSCPPGTTRRNGTCQAAEGCDPECGDDEGCHPSLKCFACQDPPTCGGEGETGRLIAVDARDQTDCLCETEPGYYWSASAHTAAPCDADGDGWTAQPAQAAIDSNDQALHDNARCEVRRVQRLILEQETGAEFVVDLDQTLPLYESVRNDDPSGSKETSYGERPLAAAALNSFTKVCASPVADFNDNGIPDASEWSGAPTLGAERDWNTVLRGYFQKYARFAYFVELHDGWYEDTGEGTYRITERHRKDRSGGGVPLEYGEGVSQDWQQCPRHLDVDYGPRAAVRSGGDLSDIPEAGMNHTSQFKCVHVVDEATYADGASLEDNPELAFVDDGAVARRSKSGVTVDYGWVPNKCGASTEFKAALGGAKLPRFSCETTDPTLLSPGVYWMAVDFEPYAAAANYERGCVDQCAEAEPKIEECDSCSPDAFGQRDVVHSNPGTPCAGGVCDGFGTCGDCVPGTVKCKPNSQTQQLCSLGRVWQDNADCGYCDQGACLECEPGTQDCLGDTSRACDLNGRWELIPCNSGWKCIGQGLCSKKDDGETCNAPGDCKSGACTEFYEDADKDGFGADQGVGAILRQCGTTPPAGFITASGDCCDSEPKANPGQTAFLTVPRQGCGGYDYDCKKGEEPSSSAISNSCQSSWVNSVPECGAAGTWKTCQTCPSSYCDGGCSCTTSAPLQGCR